MSSVALNSEAVSKPTALNRNRIPTVLLLGNDDRVMLAVARGLGRHAIKVHVGWCDQNSPVLKSRYVDRHHSLPAYHSEDSSWIEDLNELVERMQFDLVIPCNDFAVIPLQTNRKQLTDQAKWYLISDDGFATAFDKSRTSDLARSLGVKLPREIELSPTQITRLNEASLPLSDGESLLEFPVYLKPKSSITREDVANKRAAERIESAAELLASLRDTCPTDGVLIQEAFAGVGVGVEVLAANGEILMRLQHRRLRETIDGGSTYRETIAEIPELTSATRKMVRALEYTGVAMFEFRYQPESGDWVFLEINARFWGSLPLALAAGANFPLALYRLIVESETVFQSNYQVGCRCRNLIADLRTYRKQRSTKLHLGRLLCGRDHFDFFATDDLQPQLASLSEFAKNLIGKLAKKK